MGNILGIVVLAVLIFGGIIGCLLRHGSVHTAREKYMMDKKIKDEVEQHGNI